VADSIQILIADDHTMVRQGIKVLLETDPRMRVVGEAADGAEAIELLRELEVDVVLMDLRMPRMDGITALKRILRDDPGRAIIILTTFDEDELMREALHAGARGYLLKDMSREVLLRTVEAAARGETLLDPALLSRALSAAQTGVALEGEASAPAPPSSADSPLTEREEQVLRAIAEGNTSKSAAAELGIAERTVKAHLTSVFDKLGVDTRAAAIACAIQKGWL
jgi:NarL family two-component system response regulator YdfI